MSELLCISEIDDDVIFIGKYIRIKNEPILIEDDLYEPKLTPELMKADTESEKEKAYKNCIIAAEILKNKKTFVRTVDDLIMTARQSASRAVLDRDNLLEKRDKLQTHYEESKIKEEMAEAVKKAAEREYEAAFMVTDEALKAVSEADLEYSAFNDVEETEEHLMEMTDLYTACNEKLEEAQTQYDTVIKFYNENYNNEDE